MTTQQLRRVSGICAMVAGALFVAVQIGHPHLDTTSITTTEMTVRTTVKLIMATLALVGITGMYLSQSRRNGKLGFIGYVVLAIGYVLIISSTYATGYMVPSIVDSDPAYAGDVLAVARGESASGDTGAIGVAIQLQGFAYLAGGLLFGAALFRARVLARWACILLAIGGLASIVLSMMPDSFYRLLAVPNAIALIGLGYSMWRHDEIVLPEPTPSMRVPHVTPAGV